MLKGEGISFIVYSYKYFLCSCFLRGFFFAQSYWIQIIFKLIYLMKGWDIAPNPVQIEPGNNSNKEVLHTPQISRSGVSPSDTAVIPRTPPNFLVVVVGSYPSPVSRPTKLNYMLKLLRSTQIPNFFIHHIISLVNWSSRIHQLHLCKGVKHSSPQWMSWYDIKESDGEAPVMLELWGMWNTPLLLLPGPLWPGVVPLERVLSMGHIEWLMPNWIDWNKTVCLFKCVNKWLMFNWIVSDT